MEKAKFIKQSIQLSLVSRHKAPLRALLEELPVNDKKKENANGCNWSVLVEHCLEGKLRRDNGWVKGG
jgi:hypothetical protein